MKIIRDIATMLNFIKEKKSNNHKIGFIPTMGALHRGHLSLVNLAHSHSDIVICSIFVNPKQFALNEDFSSYPRTEKDDLQKLEDNQVDAVFIPNAEEIYPKNDKIEIIDVGYAGKILEGVSRPHFFNGVALVVTKLFDIILPDIAVFGKKDFQQLHIIKKLVKDLNLPIQIIGGEIVRENDGLAMSSRNLKLTDNERKIAPKLYQIMLETKSKIKSGTSINEAIKQGEASIKNCEGFELDYLEIRNRKNLEVAKSNQEPLQLLVAAYLNNIRLIDNLEI